MIYKCIDEVKKGDYFDKDFYVDYEKGEEFAKISGDFNPIHLDEKFAEKTVFKGKIAHGMLISSFISGVIGNDYPGKGTIYMKQDLCFVKPVRYGDTIKVHIEVDEIFIEKMRIRLKTECYNQKSQIVITGHALVQVEH